MRALSATATIALMLVFILFGMGLLLGCSTVKPAPESSHAVEVEDCDLEDFVNRESDCGFTQTVKPTVKPTLTKTVKPTAGTRAPRR